MSNVLSKYSKAIDLTQQSGVSKDVNSPYSFIEWIKRNIGVIPGKEKEQYDGYLSQWYITHNASKQDTSEQLKEDYKQLIKQLAIVFKSEADREWMSDINFDDPIELEQAIPFYARKLKEIAIYIINKREAVKKAKLKYNTSGSRPALERLFYEYLLKAFTRRRFPGNEYLTNVTDLSVLNALPELSAVSPSFQIIVEELYDDTEYYDKDPTVNVTDYYDLTSTTVGTYLTGKMLNTNDFDWLYKIGTSPIYTDNPLLSGLSNIMILYNNGMPLTAAELLISDGMFDLYYRKALTEKYLGETQYVIDGGYYTPVQAEFSIPLEVGNNWFYWLSGEHYYADPYSQYDATNILESNLVESGATGAAKYTQSDIIFTWQGDDYKGAWLRKDGTTTINHIMSARLPKGKTVFSFPTPGFGVSGEDLDWSGKQYNNLDYSHYYLDKQTQIDIKSLYWATTSSTLSTLKPIYIYDTPLVENGALAGIKYDDSDSITIRVGGPFDTNPNGVYNGHQQYAWLHKMTHTEIPLALGGNSIYWPFIRYTKDIPVVALSSQCTVMTLSSINMKYFLGACAGPSPQTSDIIYKLLAPLYTERETINDSIAIDAAWLSGAPITYIEGMDTDVSPISAAAQPGLTHFVTPGKRCTFIWQDEDKNANEVIKNYAHQTDCEYIAEDLISLHKEIPAQKKDLDYNQWLKCDCKALYYSPLGHPGNKFDDFNKLSDYIISITNPTEAFDFDLWRGSDGLGYKSSTEFGWFKLNNGQQNEPDVGWGPGSWITYTGQPFILKNNMMYAYYRSGLNRTTPEENAPYLILKYKYTNSAQQWIKMRYDKDTEDWISVDEPTTLTFGPGDYLYYDHISTKIIPISSVEINVTQETVKIYPTLDDITISSSLTSVSDPNSIRHVPISTFDAYGNILESFNIPYPDMTLGLPMTSIAHINNIQQYSVSTGVSSVSSYVARMDCFNSDNINYILSVPLSGWNYSTNLFDGITSGARPVWLQALDSDTESTKYKGIAIWDGIPELVDDYNFIYGGKMSNMILDSDTYVEYKRIDDTAIVWEQPLVYTAATPIYQWRQLLFDTNAVSNLTANSLNNVRDLTVTATNISSDIEFKYIENVPLLVNYYARNSFTWMQEVSSSTQGIPPTGGSWNVATSGDLITPLTPYAYLTNRHYPTYAAVPYIGNMYSLKDRGGYFIPRMLGISTAVCKNIHNIIDTVGNGLLVMENRGYQTIFRNVDIYATDRGLSKKDQTTPITTTTINSNWMKSNITEWGKSGYITNAQKHQEFIPYQTKYETTSKNDNGIRRQGDAYDPWYGDEDNVWENTIDWNTNFRKQYPIESWYEQFYDTDKQLYQWKTDIFGNQYALFKDTAGLTIYEKRQLPGELWTRDARNTIKIAQESLASVYDNFYILNTSFETQLSSYLKDFDIWYDTIMLNTTAYLLFAKISFDYDTNEIYTIADNIHRIPICDGHFGGTWFHEEEKSVIICMVNSSDYVYYPVLYSLDLETNILEKVLNDSTGTIITSIASIQLSAIEDPVFTYNKEYNKYNVSFVGYGELKQGMYVNSIDILIRGGDYFIDNVTVLTPTI